MSLSTPVIASEESSGGKRKRVRKRSARKRTGSAIAADAAASDGGESSSDQDDHKQDGDAEVGSMLPLSELHASKETPIAALSQEPEGEKTKRKRKRTRKKAVEEKEEKEEKDDKHEAVTAAYKGNAKVDPLNKDFKSYLTRLKSSSATLSNEKTVKALQYALQYHLDRAGWKFSKAKQEYLIRHMLTPPLGNTREVRRAEGAADGEEEGADQEEVERRADQYWPDEWNRCVARYLITIQGQAKQRLLDLLQREAHQEIPEEDTSQAERNAAGLPATLSAPTQGVRSVSFGDLAMVQEAAWSTSQQQQQQAAITPEERQRRLFAKQRASTLLREMED